MPKIDTIFKERNSDDQEDLTPKKSFSDPKYKLHRVFGNTCMGRMKIRVGPKLEGLSIMYTPDLLSEDELLTFTALIDPRSIWTRPLTINGEISSVFLP
ncbi:hypothetical protein PoB_005577300 [Plakobranchus ocellatus]|uniref:Uncharacterized protein n=1 Tax=Plakobranchus ocellatus TaxID=259542 RepID=A0AAV4CCV9_9GAST|nr:hypothetical protein PoB_005577300 [Plakobranchus ocellatus]